MINNLKNITICGGVGKNNFTMERGSFKYKQTVCKMSEFKRTRLDEHPDGFNISFEHDGQNFNFVLEEVNGLLKASLKTPENTEINRYKITIPVNSNLHYYGCGEVHSTFDLSGKKVRIFVAEHQNAKRIGKKVLKKYIPLVNAEKTLNFNKYESYYAQPTFVTSDKWFFHAETKGFSQLDFSRDGKVVFSCQEPPVFWMGSADGFQALSEKISLLLGHQKSLPDWVYDGAILAVQGGTEIIDRKIDEVKSEGAKVCGIWSQDWCGCRRTKFGYQVMWNWEWDRELYHNLDKKISEWNKEGIRFLGYINPFMAIEKGLYKYATEHGYCVKDNEGKDYLVTITTFPAAMIDLTNPKAWEWYKTIIKENLIGLGLSGWMADFGEYLPVDCVLHSGDDPYMMHNQWPAMWAQLNREAIEETGKSSEVFFFTRAGYTNTISNSPMMWTGDQHVDWSEDDGITSVIPATLSLAMSGFGMTHSDIGGYTTIMKMTRSKELLLRWEEMNVFTPLYRFHEGNQPSRNVQFNDDQELLKQLSWCSRAHVALKPYLKVLEKENTEHGTPVMRPLFYHYDEDKAYSVYDEYLLGRDMLVAPVLKQGVNERVLWLPDDEWIHVFTGKSFNGGTYRIDAPVGMPPVFVRKNSEYTNITDAIRIEWQKNN